MAVAVYANKAPIIQGMIQTKKKKKKKKEKQEGKMHSICNCEKGQESRIAKQRKKYINFFSER
jgi:hypothetical protein